MHDQNVYVHLLRKFFNDMEAKISGYFRLISKKNRLIATATLVLPLGLVNLGMSLRLISKKEKKGPELLIAVSMELLPHSSGKFAHDLFIHVCVINNFNMQLNSKKFLHPCFNKKPISKLITFALKMTIDDSNRYCLCN